MNLPINKGGRPKGSLNKKTKALREALRGGISPLEFLLDVMRDEKKDFSVRVDAAKSAAPYCHARLATITHGAIEEQPIPVSIEVITKNANNSDTESPTN